MCAACVWFPQRSEEGVGSSGNGVLDRCELGPWEEQSVFLTVEPTLQPFPVGFRSVTQPGWVAKAEASGAAELVVQRHSYPG